MLPFGYRRRHHLKWEMQGRTQEREPIGGSSLVKSLFTRAPGSQRFYWPTKCCSSVLTIEIPFPFCCPRDGVHDGGDTWPLYEDEYVRDLRLHGGASHTREEKEGGEREIVLKESPK